MQSIEFGPFRLFPAERRLLKKGVQVTVGSRALDLLVLLVENAGSVVSKQALTAHAWPDLHVEEGNLRVHIASLRKALSDGAEDGQSYIDNVAGRGYCFVAPVRKTEARQPDLVQPQASLPRRSTPVLGRHKDIEEICGLLAAHRFVTVHGTGGIGKTTVAGAVAEALQPSYRDGVRFLDLGLLAAGASVPDAVASALGLEVRASDTTSSIVDVLRANALVLVLDCCEHVADSAAALAEAIVRESPHVAVLATSREPLRAEGEQVYSLTPLETPPEDGVQTLNAVLSYPAAMLFHQRAVASGHRGELADADAVLIGEICRKVDGIALALELAAGRVGTHGLAGIAELLDGRLKLQWQGRRTAHPRHQTLYATLDWSHDLIGERERIVLRRLSVFVGPFPLDAAQEVAGEDLTEAEVAESIEQLVAASLVMAEVQPGKTRYRLLDVTRTYAHAKLFESGEARMCAQRHANYYCRILAQAASIFADAKAAYAMGGELLSNVRAALEWSFSDDGYPQLGVMIAVGFSQFFVTMVLVRECRYWTEKALAALDPSMHGTQIEMALRLGLGQSSMHSKGNGEQAYTNLSRALDIALEQEQHLVAFLLQSLLHTYLLQAADFEKIVPLTERAVALAPKVNLEVVTTSAEQMWATTQLRTGKLAEAHTAYKSSLARTGPDDTDPRVGYARHAMLAPTLWLLGFPAQAAEAVEVAVRAPFSDPVVLCQYIGHATASVLIWRGDLDAAQAHVDRLLRTARHHGLDPFEWIGIGLSGEMLLRRGQIEPGLQMLNDSLTKLRAERHGLHIQWLTCPLAEGLITRGRTDQALAALDEQIDGIDAEAGNFILAELLRLRGDALILAGDGVGGKRSYDASVALAERQGALSWRLRTAMSIAKLRVMDGDVKAATAELAPVYERFTEGLETADLAHARALMATFET